MKIPMALFLAVSAPMLLRETQRQENCDRNVMLVW